MAVFDDKKKKKKKKKKGENNVKKDNIDKKTGLTIVDETPSEESSEAPLTKDAQKMKDYNERNKKKKITSTTRFSTSLSGKTKSKETLTRDGVELTEEEKADRGDDIKHSKTSKLNPPDKEEEGNKEEEEDVPSPVGITPKENNKNLRKEKKRQKKERITRSNRSFEEKRKDLENLSQQELEDFNKQSEQRFEAAKKSKEIVQKAAPLLAKGKFRGKVMARRAIKKLVRNGLMDEDTAQEMIDGAKKTFDEAKALNKENKNKMFERGSSMPSASSSGGSPSIDTEGMSGTQKLALAKSQMANDLEYFKMANPVLKPTDYYPQVGRSVAVGNFSGEVIGSQTIYSGAGVVAPFGLYDARKRALAAAAKAGIANSQGDMIKLPQVKEQYIKRYTDYSDELIEEITSDKDGIYIKRGKLTAEGKKKLNAAVQTGNTINRALAKAEEFQAHLVQLKESGKNNMTGIDDVYYEPEMLKLMRELLEGETDFNSFKDMQILEDIASGEGLEYRNAEKDFTSQIMPNLLKEAAQDQENLMDGTYRTAEGSGIYPSEFIDKGSGLLTQAYLKTVAEDRINAAVEAFYEANEGMYSDKQKKGIKDLALSQIGKRETITTKAQPSAGGGGGGSSRARYMNDLFTGTTRGLKRETIPVIEVLPAGSDNDAIAGAYLTTIGGVAGTTEMMSGAIGGGPVPVTRTALDVEGSPLPIGLGNVSNLFAVNVASGPMAGPQKLTGPEIEKILTNGHGVSAYGTGTPCKVEWFKAYNEMGEVPSAQIYAKAVEDVNALGYVSGGSVIPLNEDSLEDFKTAGESNQVQIKSMMYMPILDKPIVLETRDASGNLKSTVTSSVQSFGGAYLVSKGPTTIPFNNSQQINTNLATTQSGSWKTDKNLLKP
jgi:hypothetical protein